MRGRIVKAVSGFYYVDTEDDAQYSCKPRGIFRKDDVSPLVGDLVDIEITDTKDMEGCIERILPRKSVLIRPPVANIDLALVVFSIRDPKPNLVALDTLLVTLDYYGIDAVFCINKTDLSKDEEAKRLLDLYTDIGYKCIGISNVDGSGIGELKALIKGKLITVAGPSGAGKSSLINTLMGLKVMETGDISKKIKRGKQTTRHSELISLGEDTFIADTPGFSSLNLPDIEKEDLASYFIEFRPFLSECKYSGCSHIYEEECGIKAHIDEIDPGRYERYTNMYNELKSRRKY